MLTVYQGVVHPWLCDANGHLTVRHYLAMFDDATYHLYRQVFDYAGPSGKYEGRSWAAVKQTLEYKAELPVGTLVEVRGCLARIGTKSLTCFYEMLDASTGEVAATLEHITTFFDLATRRAVPLTDEMRAAAAPHLRS